MIPRWHIIVSAFMLAMVVMPTEATEGGHMSWRKCIIRIGDFFVPTSREEHHWAPNSCGYKVYRPADVRKELIYDASPRQRAVAFAGDSTGLRDFAQAVNQFALPLQVEAVRKVASVPPRWPIVTYEPPYQVDEIDELGRPKAHIAATDKLRREVANFTYYNMRYAYFAEGVLRQEIDQVCSEANAVGGYFFVTLGNWDLNWKTHKTERVPGLSRKFDAGAATNYWTHYVGRMFTAIDESIKKCKTLSRKAPYIIIREQFMPNCAASRFSSAKNRKFKQCHSFLVPTVVPMYRRVLRGIGWAMNIPVLPTDHMFRDMYAYCGIGDGLHLDQQCMPIEQQLLWNAAQIVATSGVVQGWGEIRKFSPNSTGMPNLPSPLSPSVNVSEYIAALAAAMVNETQYDAWMESIGVGGWYKGTNALDGEGSPELIPQVTANRSQVLTPIGAEIDNGPIQLEVEKRSVNRSMAHIAPPTGPLASMAAAIGREALIIANLLIILLLVMVTRKVYNGM